MLSKSLDLLDLAALRFVLEELALERQEYAKRVQPGSLILLDRCVEFLEELTQRLIRVRWRLVRKHRHDRVEPIPRDKVVEFAHSTRIAQILPFFREEPFRRRCRSRTGDDERPKRAGQCLDGLGASFDVGCGN